MANIRSGNTWFVDTVDESLSGRNISLIGIIMTGNAGDGILVLGDDVAPAGYPTKLALSIPTGESKHLDFSSAPIVFPNGVRVKTATNIQASLIIRISGETS